MPERSANPIGNGVGWAICPVGASAVGSDQREPAVSPIDRDLAGLKQRCWSGEKSGAGGKLEAEAPVAGIVNARHKRQRESWAIFDDATIARY